MADNHKIYKDLDLFRVMSELNDAVYLVDDKGVIVAANQRCEDLLGVPADRLIGLDVDDFWTVGTYRTENYAFGYMDMSPSELLSELAEINLEDANQGTRVAISKLALETDKTMSCLCKLGNSGKIVLPVAIPFRRKGRRYALTITRNLSSIIELNNKIVDLEQKLARLGGPVRPQSVFKSSKMKKIDYLISQVADSEITVLLTGETGTGKEVVANEIHARSARRDQPLVKVNCAAIPEALFESELFGYEKGAFTGALQTKKKGFWEQADGGTILFDEIGELPLAMQSKLLRVLQEKKIQRIGGERSIQLDVRVLAATNVDLEQSIANGKFRQDLYYRLNVVEIELPPLRERHEDILPLAALFLDKFNRKYSRRKYFDFQATDALIGHQWPGNVRNMENVIEKLVVIGEKDSISRKDVQVALRLTVDPGAEISLTGPENLKDLLAQVEKEALRKALNKYKSSRKIARALGISQPTVLRKILFYGLKTQP